MYYTNYNLIIIGKNFYDQSIHSRVKQIEEKKVSYQQKKVKVIPQDIC